MPERVRTYCFTYFLDQDEFTTERPSVETNEGDDARRWLRTLVEGEIENEDGPEIRYIVIGLETCKTTGRDHLQGFVYFKNPTRWDTARTKFTLAGAVHFEAMKGTTAQAIEYCRKDGVWAEWGEPPMYYYITGLLDE